MCHKICKDGYELINYTPFPFDPDKKECDPDNPYLNDDGDVLIGALLCVDANPPGHPLIEPQFQRIASVMKKMSKSSAALKIVCVPACIANNFLGGDIGVSMTFPCSDKIIVLANSDPHGVKSLSRMNRQWSRSLWAAKRIWLWSSRWQREGQCSEVSDGDVQGNCEDGKHHRRSEGHKDMLDCPCDV